MSDGKLIFDTSIDSSGFESDLKGLESSVNSGGYSLGKGVKSILGADIIKQAAKELFDFGLTTVTTAAQMESIQTRINDVFTGNSDAVREYAKNAKENLGMAETEYLQYASIFGSYFKNAGASEEEIFKWSTDLVNRGGDLATYWSTSTDEALGKIFSALKGETEAINDFGVDVRIAALSRFAGQDMTGADQLTQLTAIYGKIMQDTANQEGTFAKMQESFAAQQKIFLANIEQTKAAIGENLLPVATSVLTAINGIFDPQVEITVTDKLADVTEQFEAFNTAAEEAATNFETAQSTLQARAELADTYMTTLETLEGKEIKTDEDVIAIQNAVAALNSLYDGLGLYVDPATGKLNENTEAIRNNIAAMQDLAMQNLFSDQWEGNAQRMAEAVTNLAAAEIELENAQAPLAELDAKIAGVAAVMDELNQNDFTGISPRLDQYAQLIPNLDEYYNRGQDGSWTLKDDAMPDVQQLTERSEATLNNLNAEREALVEGVAEAQAAVEGYNQAIADITAEQAEIEAIQERTKANMNTAGENAAQNLAEGVADNGGEIADAVADATSEAADSTDTAAAYSAGVDYVKEFIRGLLSKAIPTLKAKTSVSGTGSDGEHYSGLNYVPYDGYVAKLHVGESVLNARDAAIYRSEKTAAAAPAAPMASEKPQINVYIDGEKVSKVQSRNNSTQMAWVNSITAKGVGSK